MQADVGGPQLLAGRPAAYRLSLTGQSAGSYYHGIGNDFVSLYGAVKIRVAPDVSITAEGEYFRFRSNENPGWNRPTQSLIDRGEYIVGEPVSIVSPVWGGVADRGLLHVNPALVVPASTVDAGVNSGFITAAQRDAMLDLADPVERAQAYAGFSAPQLAGLTPTTSGYQYTPAYFAAGGGMFTAKIKGSTVLTDHRDYANSENFLYYLELENTRSPDATVKGQFLLDSIQTDKLSTYGYAISTQQLLFEAKAAATRNFPLCQGLSLTCGLSARYTDARMLQDFSEEPFSRRDITRVEVSPNTVVLTGPQRGPAGTNFWSPTAQGGANAHSKLWQFSGFAYAVGHFTDRISIYASVLAAHAPYATEYPAEVDLVPASDPRRAGVSDHRNYYSASVSPMFALAPGVNLYGTFQYGTALDPLQGGAIIGRGNFVRNRLAEGGVKAALLDGHLFAGVAAFQWRQTQYDQRTNNAELLEGRGLELEFTFAPTRRLAIIGSVNHQHVRRLTPLGFRAFPLTGQQIALYGGVLNSQFGPAVFNPAVGARPPANPGLDYPGTPEIQGKLYLLCSLASGFGFGLGPVWSDAYWHNFDHTLRIPSSLVWNGSVFLRRPRYEVELSVENLTNEDYFFGAEPVFAANTLITKAPGINGRVSLTWKY